MNYFCWWGEKKTEKSKEIRYRGMDKKKGGERGRKITGEKVRKIKRKEERRIDTRNCGNKNIFKTGIDRSSKYQIRILSV